MSAIPDNDEALLTAGQTSAALTEAGFPVAEATLDTKVTRGRWPALPEIRKHASLLARAATLRVGIRLKTPFF
jgi:hypothetical protein